MKKFLFTFAVLLTTFGAASAQEPDEITPQNWSYKAWVAVCEIPIFIDLGPDYMCLREESDAARRGNFTRLEIAQSLKKMLNMMETPNFYEALVKASQVSKKPVSLELDDALAALKIEYAPEFQKFQVLINEAIAEGRAVRIQ